ncbi:MAG: hypothetical protein OQK04_18265, partial [Kangiellaceae bacterium]|nr:hypothetical protein [Kangiellaceae bacterium]
MTALIQSKPWTSVQIFRVLALGCLCGVVGLLLGRVNAPSTSTPNSQQLKLYESISAIQSQVEALEGRVATSGGDQLYQDELAQQIAKLAAQQSELSNSVKALNRTQVTREAQSNQELASSEGQPEMNAINSQQVFESEYQAALQQVVERKSYLESELAAQSVDSHWSQTVEDYIDGLMEDENLQGVDVQDLRCGDSFCTMAFASDSEESLTRLGYEVDIGGSEGWVYRQHDPAIDKQVLVMYLAREG